MHACDYRCMQAFIVTYTKEKMLQTYAIYWALENMYTNVFYACGHLFKVVRKEAFSILLSSGFASVAQPAPVYAPRVAVELNALLVNSLSKRYTRIEPTFRGGRRVIQSSKNHVTVRTCIYFVTSSKRIKRPQIMGHHSKCTPRCILLSFQWRNRLSLLRAS